MLNLYLSQRLETQTKEFLMPLPDITSDVVVAAAKAMNLQSLESFFYRAALEAGFRDELFHRQAEDKAQELYKVYSRKGYQFLPDWVKKFAHTRSKVKALTFSEQPIRR